MSSQTIAYFVSDLLPGYDVPAGAIASVTPRRGEFIVEINDAGYFSPRSVDGDSPSTVAEAIRYRFDRRRERFDPTLPAEELGKRIVRRHPLMVADLLADPEFCRLARQAAEKGKTYTQDLLQWERKDVVCEAVAVIRGQVDAERSVEETRRKKERQETAARLERERPTREAVHASYERCGFRTCIQGHETRVEIGIHVGCDDKKLKGESYSTRCTYRKVESRHTLFVRHDWLDEVQARGLANYKGGLTLDCQVLGHTSDGQGIVYRLTCVRQGRGTGLETETVSVVGRNGKFRPLRKGEAVVEYKDRGIARDACIDCGLIEG